ncbi:hypothetical protein AAMO2058_001340100 [Amorphochlora amoebiformis]
MSSEANDKLPEALLSWGSTQGHILTGNGILTRYFKEGKHYTAPDDLPHTLKSTGEIQKVFRAWKQSGLDDPVLVGAWSRPLFSGGWKESTESDTVVYNLQTPTLFIDLRFPVLRPDLSKKQAFQDLSLDELRALSRQHCFAGYSLIQPSYMCKHILPPEINGEKGGVCVRHHALDWNYHSEYERPRPNMWRFQMSKNGESFKEFSVAKDNHQQAVYMERWHRYPQGKGPFLAMRRTDGKVESMLIVVGNHFAYARDRKHPLPDFTECVNGVYEKVKKGGCANLVDAAYHKIRQNVEPKEELKERAKIVQMLNMEGSYGKVYTDGQKVEPSWKILKSTIPWREEKHLLSPNSSISLSFDLQTMTWAGVEFKIFENSFPKHALRALFFDKAMQSKL